MAGAQQDATGAARNERTTQIVRGDAASNAPEVGDPRWADEALEIHAIDALRALDEVAGRVNVGAGMRPKAELAEIHVILS